MNDSFLFLLDIIALQCSVSFCSVTSWISHRYTYVPSLLSFLSHSTPLGSTYPSFFEWLWVVCWKSLGRVIGRASWQGSQLVSKGPNIHFFNVIQIVYSILFQFCVGKKYIGYTKMLSLVWWKTYINSILLCTWACFILIFRKVKILLYISWKRFVSLSYSVCVLSLSVVTNSLWPHEL